MDNTYFQADIQSNPPSMSSDMELLPDGDSLTSLSGSSNFHAVDADPELDGDESDPIVVCGFSMKFPQEATSSEGLWKMMMERKCAMTEFPTERFNVDGFYNKRNRLNTIPVRGGHFLNDDLSVFDANFFSLAPNEATSIDPMQRWLLEEAYRALENAGIPMENVSGSRTAVYTGSFGFDYMLQLCRDPENPPMYAALGFGISMLANRLSWFFNFLGPSIGLDSACSSTAMAIDMARKSLKDRSCDMAMVAGCNIANSPESYLWMSNIGFLSPDGRCQSFDHRANGYARGEGVGVVLLKRLSDAIRDGNTIRAVIRSTASNEDGRTPGITQPSCTAQKNLIQETYKKAGLSMAHTRFFEAHGTGTAIGDPREAQAIGSVFRKYRSTDDPVFVGALKSNIGHLEGASGLAALIKAILVLEKGIIPPNANFEKLNPKIDADFLKLKFPIEAHPWPTTGLRRASINSFGYGGANSHIVLDDAYNYLRLRSLSGKHSTSRHPPDIPTDGGLILDLLHESEHFDDGNLPKLLMWSSADKQGIARSINLVQNWYQSGGSRESRKRGSILEDLAHTLGNHRSHLQWRSFALIKSPTELSTLQSRISSPISVPAKAPRLGFVFSGQGAQWFAMGRELIGYSSFDAELDGAESYLRSLGCSWSVKGELLKAKDISNIDKPEFSQTLCTVLQVALVNLLHKFDVTASAVVGHSSGEIAAAYAGRYLSRESAWKLAYYRGICSAELAENPSSKGLGAMMSVELSEDEAKDVVTTANREASTFGLSIACINSPKNVTIAGETLLIDKLQVQLDERKVFARKLRVPVAYHSDQMGSIASRYMMMIGSLSQAPHVGKLVPMISSVTGERALPEQLLDPSYWALNMTSPVQFTKAVTFMCKQNSASFTKKIDRSHVYTSVIDNLVELGPHAALQGPLRDILRATPRGASIGYNSFLRRGCSAVETMLNTLGELSCMGLPINLDAINTPSAEVHNKTSRSLLVDLPAYPFDHSQRYWEESRLSRNYRKRVHAPSQLLGVRSNDWNPSEARWRHFIRTAELPWAEQHVINGSTLYPGAGMLVMAIEAAKQLAGESQAISSYTLRDVSIEGPMDLGAAAGALEVQTHLNELKPKSLYEKTFQFAIRTWSNDDWILNCRGNISVELTGTVDHWAERKNKALRRTIEKDFTILMSNCAHKVDSQHMYRYLRRNGYEYGPVYQRVKRQRCNDVSKQATAEVALFDSDEENHVVHPVSLDAILHLAFTAKTSGGLSLMATSIPARIGCLWISSKGLSWPEQSIVTACTTIRNVTKRGFTCAGGAVENDAKGQLCMWYDDFELVNITSETISATHLPNPKQFCMAIERKVALKELNPTEVSSFVRNLRPVKQDLSSFYQDIRLLVKMTLEQLVKTIDPTSFKSGDPWRRRYWNWAQHHLEQSCQTSELEGTTSPICQRTPTIRELSETISRQSRMGRLYVEVASNLIAMFNGEANPLELLLKSGLLKDGYADWAEYDCAKQAAYYVDLLAHQSPGMNILEVGGGTAATTRNLINALRSGEDDSMRSLRCNRYDFTDISPVFLEKAREEFAVYHSQMSFSTLNIEQNLAEQGYSEGFYDVVAADNVLHVTSNLGRTLQNIRKTMKAGGKLIMHELLRPTGWTAGFIFGVFPGWWLGVEEGRSLSPNLAPNQWDTILKANGFMGVDILFPDSDDDMAHQVGWLVATAAEDESMPSLAVQSNAGHQTIILIDKASEQQKSLSKDLVSPLQELTGLKPRVIDLATAIANNEIDENAFVILLVDYGLSFVGSLDETMWNHMSSLIQRSRRLLWVSAGGGCEANPDHALLDGLARTLRSENYELHLVTVALELTGSMTSKAIHLTKIAHEMLSRAAHQSYEQDFIEIDGLLHTQRLNEAPHLKSAIDIRVNPYQVVPTPLDGKVRFKISFASSPGSENALHYVRIPDPPRRIITDDTVEILVRAVSLQSRIGSSTLGQEEDPVYSSYYSGIVVNAGIHSAFKRGDKVIAAHSGLLCSHVDVPSQFVAKIPADLSFTDVCSVIPPIVTAYHAIVEIGQVKPTQTILVHNGASPVGQATIRLLAGRGIIDVWTTVASEEENVSITEDQLLSAERILPKAWFDNQSMLASQWKRKFDIILIQMTDSVSLLLPYVKSRGRCIKIDSSTAISTDSQTLDSAPADICIFTVPVKLATPEALVYATHISSPLTKSLIHRTVTLPASDLANILSSAHNSNEQRNTIVEFNDDDTVDVRSYGHPEHDVNSKATYLIAGGFGGLGRATARWLVSRGARYLILLSRSGPRSTEALELLSELADQGTRVEAPCCDISDRALLRSVLNSCAQKMPPIKGCIQSTMVMTERVFQKMEFKDWKMTINPKVKGSWNLHAELPKGLDFFIFFSSIMGILGTGSLAAYNAGNTYQDALAHYRLSQGERAISIDIGGVPDAGYFIDHADQLQDVQKVEKHALTYVKEICALLDIFCDPENPLAAGYTSSQAIIGIRPPAHWKHLEEVPFTMAQPFWGHMHHVPPLEGVEEDDNVEAVKREQTSDTAERLAAVESVVEAAEIVRVALTRRISILLGTPEDQLDEQKPMHSFGIDSLSAIHIRNWVGKIFDVDMPVFDILGGSTLGSASRTIAYKVKLKK